MNEPGHRSREIRTADTKAGSRAKLGEVKEERSAQMLCDLRRVSEGGSSSDNPGLWALLRTLLSFIRTLLRLILSVIRSVSGFPRRRRWHPTPVLLPGKSHGRWSLVDYSPWGRQELDTTERLHFHFSLSCIGEGNGNPLQCSCLENPRDGGAWWAAVHRVAESVMTEHVHTQGHVPVTGNRRSLLNSKETGGRPWWCSGKESLRQYRGHGFRPCMGRFHVPLST